MLFLCANLTHFWRMFCCQTGQNSYLVSCYNPVAAINQNSLKSCVNFPGCEKWHHWTFESIYLVSYPHWSISMSSPYPQTNSYFNHTLILRLGDLCKNSIESIEKRKRSHFFWICQQKYAPFHCCYEDCAGCVKTSVLKALWLPNNITKLFCGSTSKIFAQTRYAKKCHSPSWKNVRYICKKLSWTSFIQTCSLWNYITSEL